MFTVLYRTQASGPDKDARLGLAISKKHCKLATGRNRLKRQVRESFRVIRDGLKDLDIVVMNRPAAATADNKTLADSLEKHWQTCRESALKAAGKT
jgi:ribonuclease P protein component